MGLQDASAFPILWPGGARTPQTERRGGRSRGAGSTPPEAAMRRRVRRFGVTTALLFAVALALVITGPRGADAQQAGQAALPDRPIPTWLILGAYPTVTRDRVTHAYLADEKGAAPEPGQSVGALTWHEVKADSLGRVDLLTAIGHPPLEHAAAYAFSWVTSPDERTVTLAFESDDDIEAWLDGTQILLHPVARGVGSGTDTVTVRLAKGANRLLLKILNRTGGFGLGARLLATEGTSIGDLRLGAVRPADAPVSTGPAPALTLSPLSVASSATLDAAAGELRIPVEARGTRWGGLRGTVRVRVGQHEATLTDAVDGAAEKVTLPTTWSDLVSAVARGDSGLVASVEGGPSFGRAIAAGPVLSVLAHPIQVEGWRWRDSTGVSHELTDTSAYGVGPVVVRDARSLSFRTRVPEALSGLTLEMDAAEFGVTGSTVRVDGQERAIAATGRVSLCAPCHEGDSLVVVVDPAGQWWDPPRLVVPDPGWMEISQGARWARYFLGDAASPAPPGPAFARQLLAATSDPGKLKYQALVAAWMANLTPAIRRMKADTIDVVGNSHIDAAWLWRWPETVDVVRNTWRTAAKLLDKYPGTTFAGSAAVYYEWVKNNEPWLLSDLQRLQKARRWAAVGGWWLESDANLPSGEAFVRQGLYGQRLYQELFGTMAHVAWLPDTFGYAFTLPQIFKKQGMDFFVTQKLRWNDTDKWTADRNLFWWEGRDGTRVLTYIPYGYSDVLEPDQLAQRFKVSQDSTAGGMMMDLYGEGDHGGGPTKKMLDRANEIRRIPTFPTLHGALPWDVMKEMEKKGGATAPVIHDELYLEFHRGTYTSQSEMKAWNRRMEGLLEATEVASVHASFFTPADATYDYPRGPLTRSWEKVLFNQFHDLLPGSGIGPNYKDAEAKYRDAERLTDIELGRAADVIAGEMNTRSPVKGGEPYVVLNPSGHARDGVVTIPWTGGAVDAVDSTGAALPSAVRGDTLRVRVGGVPATGAAVVWVVPGMTEPAGAPSVAVPAAGAPAVIQNDRLRVEIDRTTGEISRIVDLASGRDVLLPGGGGNRLAARYDKPAEYDAWNIDNTRDPYIPVRDTVQVGRPGRNALGPYIDVLRADSTGRYEQHISLPDGQARIAFDTRALWRADHELLKASFPLAVHFDSTWAEIPYGAIERPSVPLTRKDSARYETPMQRWVDASDGTWGVGLVTDSKYGYDTRGDTLRLTLLKAPKSPDPTADMGWHHFRYDLVVHAGDWRSGPVERVADALNEPLHALPVPSHDGQGRSRSFLRVEGEGVRLGALKLAEDNDDIVARLVESHGVPATATLELPWPFEWRSADLLERPDTAGGWTASSGDRASVPLKPWDIATVLIRRR